MKIINCRPPNYFSSIFSVVTTRVVCVDMLTTFLSIKFSLLTVRPWPAQITQKTLEHLNFNETQFGDIEILYLWNMGKVFVHVY